jgi:hypothetical protein
MGLDMYLRAQRYIGDWEHSSNDKERETYKATLALLGLPYPICGDSPSITINVTVGYWHKANAIHKWFVDNVQKGVDDCGDYELGRDDLEKLKAVCLEVLDDRSKAEALLPTQSGFFFGDTRYDEDYFSDLRQTVSIIDKVLALPDLYFVYHSSW